MSEQEREVELVAGVIQGITQKKADTWTVAVLPDGSQYAKNLWTKDADLVESLSTKFGQAGAFVCGISVWQKDGRDVRSLWINSVADGTENLPERVATPVSAEAGSGPRDVFTKPHEASGGMSKEEWARKDSAIHKMACIKTAADALKHTVPSEPTNEQLNEFVSRTLFVAVQWHGSVLAERDDPTGEGVPF